MHKGFIIKTALLYLRRSYRSTLVLGVMIFAAVACLVLLSALAVGTNDAMIRNSVGLYSGHIAASGLPDGLDPGRLAMAGTAGVLIRQIQPATIANSNGSRMESVLLAGVDPELLPEILPTRLPQLQLEDKLPHQTLLRGWSQRPINR